MTEKDESITKKLKDKVIPDVEMKEGRASEFTDGVADTSVGIAKTVTEIFRAPLRATGRIIDGAIAGAKDGIEQSSNPIEGTVKTTTGTVIGAVKGLVKGAQAAANKVGEGFSEMGDGVKKVGSSLSSKKEHNDKNQDE